MVNCSFCESNQHNVASCHQGAIERSVCMFIEKPDPVTNTNWINNTHLLKPKGCKLICRYYRDIEKMHENRSFQTNNIVYKLKTSTCYDDFGNNEYTYIIIYCFNRLTWVYYNRAQYLSYTFWTIIDNETLGENLYNEYSQSGHELAIDFINRERLLNGLLDQSRDSFNNSTSISLIPISTKVYNSDNCSICFEKIQSANKCILRCGHEFCGTCVFNLLLKNNKDCAICRCRFI